MSEPPQKKQKTDPENGIPEIRNIIEKRSDKVDFYIVYEKHGGKGEKIKYGVEKSRLIDSSLFQDMFDFCSNKDGKVMQIEEVELFDKFPPKVVCRALEIISGVVPSESWSIDFSADMIDFGHKYGSEIVSHFGLHKFCGAFGKEKNRNYALLKSRYGTAALVKYISVWRRLLESDISSTKETADIYFWCFERIWPFLCDRYRTTIHEASIGHFVRGKTHPHLTAEEISFAASFIEKYSQHFERLKDNSSKDLCDVLQALSEEQKENDKEQSDDNEGQADNEEVQPNSGVVDGE
ncbi:uncharacterized protein FA14DRAFT_169625 [Meira miltonrushii]|uniref:BTB domain-containing protein n=1 Tax=Meira miltonrushii TaxID=1280837 RepID=A0A316VKR6_9BASI|nr:uncharacterized protein FA14DRAFT_169625 [Meira miltonrushii]PWN36651.1 hypothetical protein FA14DRAFT_169625 [Meira miltonrushii]